MLHRYITLIRSSAIAIIAVLIFGVIGNLSMNQTAQAWCDNVSLAGSGSGYDNVCVSRNYDSLPSSVKNTVSRDEYVDMAKSCMSGNAYGLDFGIREGGCADAAASCLKNAVDREACTGDVMADMVGGIFSDPANDGCNEGKLTGSGSDNCGVLKEANQAILDRERDETIKKASENCTIPQNASEEQKTLAREACTKAISDACTAPTLNNNGTVKSDSDYTNYQNCLNNALTKSAKDRGECESRGGVWMDKDTKDPNGPNTLSKGCYNQATDLTNPEACAAAGYEWKRTNKPGQPEAWGCVDPDNPDGEDNDNPDDPTAGPGGKGTTKSTKTCGAEARVNLLECESGDANGGATALGNILRVFVIVLSFGVGVAAVGGLAYSAIQYAGASDNQGNVSAARERIRNIVIGLLLFGFLVAITNWLVPGGVL